MPIASPATMERALRRADQELRLFADARRVLVVELALAAIAAAALWGLAADLDRRPPEIAAVFVAAGLLLATALLRLVPQLPSMLGFRCPRCERSFHASFDSAGGAVLRYSACAHCGFALRRRHFDWRERRRGR